MNILGKEREAVLRLCNTLFEPGAEAIGQMIGDVARNWRLMQLRRISDKFFDKCRENGFDPQSGRKIALSIGLPLLEKASLQDDDYLQDKWASLLFASVCDADQDGGEIFSLSITFVEILAQFSRLDCLVLEYIVNRTVKEEYLETIIPNEPIPLKEIRGALSEHKAVSLSVEKLAYLGCVERLNLMPLRSKEEGDGGLHPFADGYLSTLTGMNLYAAASGRMPKGLSQEQRRE